MDNSKIKVSGNVKVLFKKFYELWYSAGLLLKVGLHKNASFIKKAFFLCSKSVDF